MQIAPEFYISEFRNWFYGYLKMNKYYIIIIIITMMKVLVIHLLIKYVNINILINVSICVAYPLLFNNNNNNNNNKDDKEDSYY